jgi:hypothetical protein
MHQTVADLIDSLTAHALAVRTGRQLTAVRMWKSRGVIPRSAWPEIMQAFPAVTIETLLKCEAAPASSAPAEA